MAQINIKINKELDKLFAYLAEKKKIPKAVLVKELLLENIQEKILPQLLKDYEEGKISLKRILYLTEISPDDILEKIHQYGIKCPITPEIDDYTAKKTEDLILKIGENIEK